MTTNNTTNNTTSNNKKSATLLGLLAILCWSTYIGLIRSISEELTPVLGAALIYTVSALFLIIVKGFPRIKNYSKHYLILCGSLFVIYEIALSQAIGLAKNRSQSLELGLINYAWPCLTILVAIIMRHYKGNFLLFAGMFIAFFGVFWAMKGDSEWALDILTANIKENPVAYSLAFLAAISWAIYCNVSKLYNQENGVTLFFIAVSIVLWLKFLINDHNNIEVNFSVSVIFQLLVMGAFTASGYYLWNVGIQKGDMILLATASYFTPLFSILIASLWLNTLPSFSFWQAVVMVIIGSLICWLGTKRQK